MQENMNKFSILTICTENYGDAINFSPPSWLRLKSMEKIYIYSDFDLQYPDDRVIILNEIKKTDDWLEVVGLKPEILNRFIRTYSVVDFVFIDIDCYITDDISEVFDNDFDIAPTRMNVKNVSANNGVFFCRNNNHLIQFIQEWMLLQTKYIEKSIGVKQYAPSYSQLSFSEILHRELHNKTYLNVFPLSASVYNNEADLEDDWLKKIKHTKYKILHFKGRRWRNEELVRKILG